MLSDLTEAIRKEAPSYQNLAQRRPSLFPPLPTLSSFLSTSVPPSYSQEMNYCYENKQIHKVLYKTEASVSTTHTVTGLQTPDSFVTAYIWEKNLFSNCPTKQKIVR